MWYAARSLYFFVPTLGQRDAVANRLIKLLPNRATPGRFYKLATADGVVSLAMDSVVAPAIDESRMCATAIISTPAPDRVRDVMVPRGIWLDDYRLNPVVLWEHGLAGITTPIAKSEHADGRMAIEVFDDRVEGTAYHTSKNQESANIFGLLAERIVRASSIRAGDNSKSSLSRGPDGQAVMVVSWWPLIEWSWGMVGVNPETVTKVLDRGRINGDKLAPTIRKSLIPFAAKVRTDTKKPPLPLTSKLQKTLAGKKKTMEPNEAEQLQARLAELSPDELAAELEAAKTEGDAELVKLIEGALAKGKTDKPGEEVPPEESADSLDGAPPSARFLSMLHGKLASVVSEAESLAHTYENPEAQELVKGVIDQIKSSLGSMATSFLGITGKAFSADAGKCDECKDDEGKEDELQLMKTWIAEGGVRPLQAQGHAAQLKAIARQKTLTLNDQATLAAVAAIFTQGVGQQRARIKSLAAQKNTPAPVAAPVIVSVADEIAAARAAREKLAAILPK